MRPTLVVFILTAAGIPVAAQPDPAKAELAKLKGTWAVKSIRAGGMEVPGAKIETLRFDETLDGLGTKMTLRLNPARTPKEIDLIRSSDGRVWMGIYKLDGDDLTLSLALVQPGKVAEQTRPTDFDPQKVQMVITATRAKE